MKTVVTILSALLLTLLLGGLEFTHERDRLKAEKEMIAAEWTKVETGLDKRAALLPALTELLQPALPEQAALFQSLADARNSLSSSRSAPEKIDAHNRISDALGRVYVALETHPRAAGGDAFQKLQRSLESAENEVLRARSRYNAALKKYNTDLSLFPANLAAAAAGLEREDAYFVTEPARPAPQTSPNLIK